ncbi:hypothetical protein NKI77_30360 [Mesorhizobium opportunistum]|uniref:hypothetical protein n=1 Tax=Mesorhizobium opportunistum TaxID=593909 RepID=UPI00333DEF4F
MLDDDTRLTTRDITIATTALIVGTNISLLRQKIIDGLFDELSEAQIVSFAVADANRAFSILREKNFEMIERTGAVGGVFHGPGTTLRKLNLGPSTAPTTAEDMNTTVVDTIPHWFAQARKQSGAPDHSNYNFNLAGARAQWGMSLEHALTDVWQQVLWEPWVLSSEQADWKVGPPDQRSHSLWRAWALRDQVNLVQRTMLSRHDEEALGKPPAPLVRQTATGIETMEERMRPLLGDPTLWQTKGHLSAIELLDRSYLGPFLDQALSPNNPGMTPRLLTLVLGVLQDLAEFALPERADVEYRSQADIDRLRCAFAAADLKSFISRALEIDEALASACLTQLTSDAFGPLNPLFRDGLWHRPLISNQDGTELYMLLGSLLWGAPVRRVERWLKGAEQDADLSETPTGKAHEISVRERIQSALRSNPLLSEVSSDVTLVSVKEGEDIDALVRIGKTILVMEVKCFLAPAEPVERHNYVHKLESACEQARRKAQWLSEDHSRIPAMLRRTALEAPRFVPLVVVNQSSGSSCRFGSTVVIDEHFLVLYLSGGSYVSAAALDFKNPGRTGFATRVLYQTAKEGENAIPDLFESHPGLANFVDAMIWETRELPLHGGNKILMYSSLLDPDRYIAGLPAVHTLE